MRPVLKTRRVKQDPLQEFPTFRVKKPRKRRKPGEQAVERGERSLSKNSLRRLSMTQKAIGQGRKPLEVMLENMRHYFSEAEILEYQAVKLLERSDSLTEESAKALTEILTKMQDNRMQAQSCARDAAPYVHPRLSAIAVKGDADQLPITMILATMSAEQAAQLYAQTRDRRGSPMSNGKTIEHAPSGNGAS